MAIINNITNYIGHTFDRKHHCISEDEFLETYPTAVRPSRLHKFVTRIYNTYKEEKNGKKLWSLSKSLIPFIAMQVILPKLTIITRFGDTPEVIINADTDMF